MESTDLSERLSRISTLWSRVFQAHEAPRDAAAAARNDLMLRYYPAVYRYLLGAVRDPDVASDLTQEFALRFVRGDFRRAEPGRGRFRDYLRTSLSRLVSDHHRKRRRLPAALSPDAPEPAVWDAEADGGPDFVASWREGLLDRTWLALAEANAAYHAVLLHRIDQPDAASAEMAACLTARLGKAVNAAWVRKTLQRAHEKFADLLLGEVSRSLDDPSPRALRDELEALDLLKFCRTALARRP